MIALLISPNKVMKLNLHNQCFYFLKILHYFFINKNYLNLINPANFDMKLKLNSKKIKKKKIAITILIESFNKINFGNVNFC